jgi:hypothetical protein
VSPCNGIEKVADTAGAFEAIQTLVAIVEKDRVADGGAKSFVSGRQAFAFDVERCGAKQPSISEDAKDDVSGSDV